MNYISNKNTVIIYGAGNDGRSLCHALRSRNLTPSFFIDINAEKIKTCEDLPVYAPGKTPATDTVSNPTVYIALSSYRHYNDALQTLRNLGFSDIRNGVDAIFSINQESCISRAKSGDMSINAARCLGCCTKYFMCPVYRKLAAQFAPVSSATLEIPYVAFMISTRCVLRCKDCHTSIPYLEPRDWEMETVLRDVELFLRPVKYVGQLALGTGEIFLYRHLPELLDRLLCDRRIGSVLLTTTGGFIPSKELVSVLDDPRICISVSSYGGAIPVTLKRRSDKFAELLKSRNKPFRFNKSIVWWDLGEPYLRKRSEEEHKAVFLSCELGSHQSVFEGKLYLCARTYTLDQRGIIKAPAVDFVDIRNENSLNQRLPEFIKKDSLDACRYCNGTAGCPEIPAGVQIDRTQKSIYLNNRGAL